MIANRYRQNRVDRVGRMIPDASRKLSADGNEWGLGACAVFLKSWNVGTIEM